MLYSLRPRRYRLWCCCLFGRLQDGWSIDALLSTTKAANYGVVGSLAPLSKSGGTWRPYPLCLPLERDYEVLLALWRLYARAVGRGDPTLSGYHLTETLWCCWLSGAYSP